MSAAVPAVELRDITCTFLPRTRRGAAYTAVRDVSLRVADGEFVSIVGPTGCGKSTLLNMTAGLLTPTSGSVSVFGEPLAGLNGQAGYMFQAEALMPWRNAVRNVMAGLEIRGVPLAECRERALSWLERVGLAGRGDAYLHQLSGGMRKRVALAQILILEPRILLMDEPFGALDVQTRQLMENELLALWSSNRKSVMFITHDLEEAISLSDRVVVMSAGPASRPIGEFVIDLPRPRDVAEIRLTPAFLEIHAAIWETMRDEVLKGYAQHERA
jgi:NitT/TauT family transport system ATP-binding protein